MFGMILHLSVIAVAFANHRALAQILGVILRLPPIKQALASKQFKSVYLDKLLSMQYKKK